MARFLTYVTYDNDDVQCLCKDSWDELSVPEKEEIDGNFSEYVWQNVATREDAIKRHYIAMDMYEANPNKLYY